MSEAAPQLTPLLTEAGSDCVSSLISLIVGLSISILVNILFVIKIFCKREEGRSSEADPMRYLRSDGRSSHLWWFRDSSTNYTLFNNDSTALR